MRTITVKNLTTGGQVVPESAGIPRIYLRHINNNWHQRGDGESLAILLQQREDLSWRNLGERLVENLATLGIQIGLSFIGQIPINLEEQWLPVFVQGKGPSVVAMKIAKSPLPKRPENWTKNVTWNSVQPISEWAWISSIWANAESAWFNQGGNLLIAVYDSDVISRFEVGIPLTTETFGRTLQHAVGWMSPIDDNIGFIIGLPQGSKIRNELQR